MEIPAPLAGLVVSMELSMIYRLFYEVIHDTDLQVADFEDFIKQTYGIPTGAQLWALPMRARILEYTDVDTLMTSAYDVSVNHDKTKGISIHGQDCYPDP